MSDNLSWEDFNRDWEENMEEHKKRALILVDIQRDFCKGGALEVPDAEKIIPIVNDLMMNKEWDYIVATKDWHPRNHKSFASNHKDKKIFDVIKLNGIDQVLWPDHCVQESFGSRFHEQLDKDFIDEIVTKGDDPEIDSYSGFFDNDGKRETELLSILGGWNIDDVYIIGLATDYCVKFTALDSDKLGFNTYVITDAIRGLDKSGEALEEMERAGISLIESGDVK